MAIIDQILAWEKQRPLWQRDALRRLISGEEISKTALNELFQIAIQSAAHDLQWAESPKIQLLDRSHFRIQEESNNAVVLKKISDVKNVNAIASISPLEFAPQNLSVIYGGNGSGKSGYVRILKKVCSCRDASFKILRNVFSREVSGEQSAIITYESQGKDSDFKWNSDVNDLCPELKSLHVFDSRVADIFITKENDLEYIPMGLDIFRSLGDLCGQVKEKIENEIKSIPSQLPKINNSLLSTKGANWLSNLTYATQIKEIEAWTTFTEEDKEKLRTSKNRISEDPIKKSGELKAKAARYELIVNVIETCEKVNDEQIKEAQKTRKNFEAARHAYNLASKETFANNDKYSLQGVGSEAWQILWESARKYSELVAYPGIKFPEGKEIEICVLCQQVLSEKARGLFIEFENFVKHDIASNYGAKAAELDIKIAEYEKLVINLDTNIPILEEIKLEDSTVAGEIQDFLNSSNTRRDEILSGLKGGVWKKFTTFTYSPETKLKGKIEQIRNESESVKKVSNPEEINRLKNEVAELEAKKWISENKDAILLEVDRLKKMHLLNEAKRSTNPRGITETSNELVEKYVGEELRKTFEDTINDLFPGKFRVVLDTRGDHATTYHSIKLTSLNERDVSVADVVSEGEYRTIALAAFLTELLINPNKSGIVFDDPVSSLDHEFRKNVAKKLAQIAADRQVIVFTHDVYFLMALVEASKTFEVERKMCQLVCDGRGVGICDQDIPFHAKKVNDRIKELTRDVENAKKIYKSDGLQAYLPHAHLLWDKYRITLERTVEEVYVNDVVARYKWNVTTKGKIGRLGKITPEDCTFIDEMMDKYSTPLHDPGADTPPSPPVPEDIARDVTALSERIRDIRNR
jgi:energy-coupling factor transporter ATP-binding protein EcfA2